MIFDLAGRLQTCTHFLVPCYGFTAGVANATGNDPRLTDVELTNDASVEAAGKGAVLALDVDYAIVTVATSDPSISLFQDGPSTWIGM